MLTRKCFAQLIPLRMIQPQVSKDNMKILMNLLVLSNLNSMVAVWGSADLNYLKSTENIVKSTARLVLNKRPLDPVSKYKKEKLNCVMPLSLSQKALLTKMYKLINSDHAPDLTTTLKI